MNLEKIMKPTYLDVTTWDGYDPNASHYYGTIQCGGYKTRFDITDPDDGDTMRIRSERRLFELAIKEWLTRFPDSRILIAGRPTRCDPQEILAVNDDSL